MQPKSFPTQNAPPPLPATATAAGSSNSLALPIHRVYINEDLTKTRAEVAAKARQLKRDGKVDDTWIRDDFIVVKKKKKVTLSTESPHFGKFKCSAKI